MVLLYTCVRGLVFADAGGVASRLLQLAERNPDLGFGILLRNLLAAAVMAGYFWRRHPNLKIRP